MGSPMTIRMATVKRVLVGLSVVAAFGVAPALASGPTLTDNGSAFWQVNANGAQFTPNNWAYVKVVEGNGAVSADGWFRTSSGLDCASGGLFHFCFPTGNGTFSATLNPNGQCTPGRTVQALDAATGLKSNALPVSCR